MTILLPMMQEIHGVEPIKNSPQRFAEDYITYESEFYEDPTQYYPIHKLLTFPKLYNVTNKNDEAFCKKKFPFTNITGDGNIISKEISY